MTIAREDVLRFAVASVCRGKRTEEIVVDLTDANVARPFAQRLVDELVGIRQELRTEGAAGLEEKVLRAWSSRGIPIEFEERKPRAQRSLAADVPPSDRKATSSPSGPVDFAPDYLCARVLVGVFRCLALVVACWGVWWIIATMNAAQAFSATVKQFDPHLSLEAQFAKTVALAVFTAILQAVAATALPLFLAEVLNLLLAIQSNTRRVPTRPGRLEPNKPRQS